MDMSSESPERSAVPPWYRWLCVGLALFLLYNPYMALHGCAEFVEWFEGSPFGKQPGHGWRFGSCNTSPPRVGERSTQLLGLQFSSNSERFWSSPRLPVMSLPE